MNPTYIIPGHGHLTNLAPNTRSTHDDPVDLRAKVGAHIDEGGDLAGAVKAPKLQLTHQQGGYESRKEHTRD